MKRVIFLFLLIVTWGGSWVEGIAQPLKVESHPGITGSTLEEIKARGKLFAGVTMNEPPLGFVDKTRGFQGFFIDVAEDLAKRIFEGKANVEFIGIPVQNWADSLKSKKVDFLLAPLFMSEDPKKEMDFSVPCFVSGGLILVKRDGKIRRYQDLAGKSLATIRGTKAGEMIRELLPNSKLVEFSNNADALQALKGGKVDAFAQLDIFVFYMAEHDKNLVVLDPKPFHPSSIKLGVGKDDKEWRDFVDKALLEMMTTGEYRKIMDKWFGKVRGEFLDQALKNEIKKER
jgi:ABC-type amino acid transport substrate-binding protein